MEPELFIGALSGTSIDGIDVALVRFAPQPELVATHRVAYPAELRRELLALCLPGENEIDRLGGADVAVGREFAAAVQALLAQAGVAPGAVRAIGSHGQTIRHRPNFAPPFTLQIGDPNVIAAQTGIPVVADFRRKDLALGGQGAPLVPAFHEAIFRQSGTDRVVVNIGGIANLTVLPGDAIQPIAGFDTGPGNTLLDRWSRHALDEPMDRDGALAARGRVDELFLKTLLADPYFAQLPPKSTGPEYFSTVPLAHLINAGREAHADVQATLVALTARTIADGVRRFSGLNAGASEFGNTPAHRQRRGDAPIRGEGAASPATPDPKQAAGRAAGGPQVFVCGGGARNPVLMRALADELPDSAVAPTDTLGVPADWVEALAFAWLARQRWQGGPGNNPGVTGATRAAVLGGLWLPE